MTVKKTWMIAVLFLASVVTGCSDGASPGATGSASAGEADDTLTIAWYPNESGAELKNARDEIANVIEEATGKTVEHQTTTDYIIAIEALANGQADLAFMGAQGYIEAHNKNESVAPLVVPSGESGTLDDAVYHSWLAVKKGNEGEYQDGDKYTIDHIVGKTFSFVSNSSTSGFKVPSDSIVSYFSEKEEYKDLTPEDLLEGGKFFREVLYGGSHQGSAVNLLTDKVDVAAFCDTCVDNYIELAEGEANTPGAVYSVKEGAAEPFDAVVGEQFVLISVTPVLNAPFAVNTETVSEADRKALVEAFTSDEVANNENIFVPEDGDREGLFTKTGDERFVEVEDSWFDPIRELSN